MNETILGIHDGHNASVVVLRDGEVVYAVQEERINREKNYFGFPFLALQDAMSYLKLQPSEIDCVAMASKHYPSPYAKSQLLEIYRNSSSLKSQINRYLKKTPAKKVHRTLRRKSRLADVEKAGLDPEKVKFVEHHSCHAAAAYWGSPWRGEEILVLTCDGAGDDICASVNIVSPDGEIKRLSEVKDGDSIGRLYANITFAMGMTPNEHEYKLMGLAPYAYESCIQEVAEEFAKLFKFENNGLSWRRTQGTPHMFHGIKFLNSFIRYRRFDCLAAGLQRHTEDFLIEWVQNCVKATCIKKVALGGGVFMNVKANKRIMELPEIDGLFVFPSCGDETNSVGAAFQAYAEDKQQNGETCDISPIGPLYWGRDFSDEEIKDDVDQFSFSDRVNVTKLDNPDEEVARLLAGGEVVARFQGRMEFGARALGNRSIVANPTNWEVIKVINEMIKKRDFWMPFAPSLMGDLSESYFIKNRSIRAPYMILSFNAISEKVSKVIAAVHPYDYTVRPQEVYADWNPGYYSLISHFKELTGEGIILNTSFNLHGYPIVYKPQDALEVFENSGLNYLSIGSYLISKEK